MITKLHIYQPVIFILLICSSGLFAQSQIDSSNTCFSELFEAGIRIANTGVKLLPSAIDHFEAARACPDTDAKQEACALEAIADANEKWRNSLQSQIDRANALLITTGIALDSAEKAKIRADKATLKAISATRQAERSGAISEANRLALTANGETDAGSKDNALMLAYWAKIWSCDTTITNVEVAFGNAAFLNYAKKYNQIDGGALGVHFDPNSERHYIRSYSGDIYDGDTREATLKHDRYSHDLLFDVRQNHIVTVSEGKTRAWNHEGALLNTKDGDDQSVTHITYSPDGNDYVAAGRDGNLVLWVNGSQTVHLKGHTANITHVEYSADGAFFLSVSLDKTVIVWNSKGILAQKLDGHTGFIRDASFSADGQHILTASTDGQIIVWDKEGEEKARLDHNGVVTSATFSPDQNHILSTSTDGVIRIWSLNGMNIYKSPDHNDWILSAHYMKDNVILSRSLKGEIVLWNTNLNTITKVNNTHRDHISEMIISEDRIHFLTISNDLTVKLWNIEGTELMSPPKFNAPVWAAGFSPDGKKIWACAGDETAWICELPELIFEDLRNNIHPVPTPEQQNKFQIKENPPCEN